MSRILDRFETAARWILRLPPKPSTDPVLTPFARHARRVRREALGDERARRRQSWIERETYPGRRREAPR